jgi:N6-L-threonylcarbamoyladenine synthase
MPGYDFSFSGLKTAVLYFVEQETRNDPAFIEKNRADLCASVQHAIVDALLHKLTTAARDLGVTQIAIAGGVSANSGLRAAMEEAAQREGWQWHVPPFEFCTDNAAMIAVSGSFRYRMGLLAGAGEAPFARFTGF